MSLFFYIYIYIYIYIYTGLGLLKPKAENGILKPVNNQNGPLRWPKADINFYFRAYISTFLAEMLT